MHTVYRLKATLTWNSVFKAAEKRKGLMRRQI